MVTVKFWLALPCEAVTVSGPVVALVGTVVVIMAAVIVRITAAAPLKLTWLVPGSKPVPVIVTRVPITLLAGSTLVILGPSCTVKVRDAGVESSFPAKSRALTSKMCDPAVRLLIVALVAVVKEE